MLQPFLPPPIIPRRRLDAGMARQILDRHNIRPSIQQIADKRPPEIVGGEIGDFAFERPLAAYFEDGLFDHPAALVDGI